MAYKNPIGPYKPMKQRKSTRPPLSTRQPKPAQCGQGVVIGDQRYCSKCFRWWDKNDPHPE